MDGTAIAPHVERPAFQPPAAGRQLHDDERQCIPRAALGPQASVTGVDTGELMRIADRIESAAHTLRGRARTLSVVSAGVQWRSPAATAARRSMQHTVDQLAGCAVRLEHAALALRTHAGTVRRRHAALVDAERSVARAGDLGRGALSAIGRRI